MAVLLLSRAAGTARAENEPAATPETPPASAGSTPVPESAPDAGAAHPGLAGGQGPDARPPPANDLPRLSALGSLERESVDEALALLGKTVEQRPDGKRIDRVYVVNQDVFSPRDWHFQLLNVFHRTTRPYILSRELLLSPGQLWDESLANETVRNLQWAPPLFFVDGSFFGTQLSSVVALVPVTSLVPGSVDLLVVTRDLWSLRLNTDFDFQKDTLSRFEISLAENNLFGWRKHVAVRFQLDLGRFGIGPRYFDPNVAGSRLTLLAAATAWYARDSSRPEGHSELFSLRRPLYSLASRWGAGLDISNDDVVSRRFCDEELCPADVGGASVPFIYRRRSLIADGNVVRSFGQSLIQRLTAGWRVDRRRSLAPPDTPVDPDARLLVDQFLAKWAPLSETRSEPYLRYETFVARYGMFRDLDTFDLREYRRLGPFVVAEIGAGVPLLGADFVAYPMSATVSWAVAPWGSGFAAAQVQASARLRAGELIDRRLSALVHVVSPPLAEVARLVLAATVDTIRADTYRTRFFVGGNTGLRGYQIGELQGTTQLVAHAEIRTMPLAVFSQRFGGVVFYDMGGAAGSLAALLPRHDVGVGLRWLIPQLNSSVVRIDWAIATNDGPYTRPGLPGRITAGYWQSFGILDSPKGYVPPF